MKTLGWKRADWGVANQVPYVPSAAIICPLLIASSILKMKSPAVLASWIHATFLWDIPSFSTYFIGLAELGIVAAILMPRSRQIGFYACAILSSGFIGVSLARLVFKLSGNCGCYGALAFSPIAQLSIATLIYSLSISNLIFTRKP